MTNVVKGKTKADITMYSYRYCVRKVVRQDFKKEQSSSTPFKIRKFTAEEKTEEEYSRPSKAKIMIDNIHGATTGHFTKTLSIN